MMRDEKPTLTRAECENAILDLLDQIADVYKQYHPNGTRLSLYWHKGYKSVFNQYWDSPDDPGADKDFPIHVSCYANEPGQVNAE